MEFIIIMVLVISFLLFLSLGVPIAYSLGLSATLTLLMSADSLVSFTTLAQRMATGLDSFTLLAIPFFILAGQLMNKGGIAIRLIDFAKVLVGKLPGGIAALCRREISVAKLMTKAGMEGDRNAAIQAFALDSMVNDLDKAEKMVDDYLETHKKYLPQFFN